MNTEDSEFARIEREQAMRGVPDAIHHTDTSESLEYIQGWNDCRAAMLAEQPAQQEPVDLEIVYETIIEWDDEGGGKRSRRALARRIVALYTSPAIEAAHGIKENT